MDNKFNFRTPNFRTEAAKQIGNLFPEVISDDRIDFEALKELLFDDLEDNIGNEKYEFTWRGKKEAKSISDSPSENTALIANKKKSKDFESTKNVYIEGDNLEVLKLLQRAYRGKIKLIYIDPPYNTGKDFIYNDTFYNSYENYLKQTGQVDGDGNTTTTNKNLNGRFHTDWLNMMYPRIKLAWNLLRDDGVIFISINDKEVKNLRSILDEIFGERNFIAQLIWNTDGNIDNQSRIKTNHEYILMYSKNESSYEAPKVIAPEIDHSSKLYNDEIANTIVKNGPKNPQSNIILPIGFPTTSENVNLNSHEWPIYNKRDIKINEMKIAEELEARSGWSSQGLLQKFIDNGFEPVLDSKNLETRFALTDNGAIYMYKKRGEPSHVLSIIRNVGNTQQQSKKLKEIEIEFTYPKPVSLIQYLIKIANVTDEDIVLDFFSGSGSTAEAVMKNNINENRESFAKFIMVQLPEKVENSKFQNLCELGEYRISKTGQEIITQKDNLNKELDVGFKVYELRNSTLRQWDENPETFEKQMELFSISPFIDTSTNGEIADEIALKTGIPLDVSPMVENEIYHYYNFEKELFIVLGDYDETLLEVLEDNRVLQFATIVIMELEEGSEIKFNLIEKLKQDENLQNHFNVEWI